MSSISTFLSSTVARCVPAPLLSLPFVAGLEVARGSRYLTPPEELNGRSFAITVSDFGMRHVFVAAMDVSGRIGLNRPIWNFAPRRWIFLVLCAERLTLTPCFFKGDCKFPAIRSLV